MNKIQFSVLMSVYKNDKPDFLKIAIDSILNQTLRPNQFVIMVDGPISEDLKNVLLDYEKKDKIIELHFRDKNLGLGLTLNEGLNYCKYDYIARMDADDYCYFDRFEKQISVLENNNEIDVVGCNIAEYDEELKIKLASRVVPEKHNDIEKYMKSRNGVNHVTVIFKKEAVLNSGNYEDCPYFEDYYLWCKMINNGYKFYNIQEELMKIRAGVGMVQRRGGKSYCKHIINFEKKIKLLGMINNLEYLKNVFIRTTIALLPGNIRASVYEKRLRRR